MITQICVFWLSCHPPCMLRSCLQFQLAIFVGLAENLSPFAFEDGTDCFEPIQNRERCKESIKQSHKCVKHLVSISVNMSSWEFSSNLPEPSGNGTVWNRRVAIQSNDRRATEIVDISTLPVFRNINHGNLLCEATREEHSDHTSSCMDRKYIQRLVS